MRIVQHVVVATFFAWEKIQSEEQKQPKRKGEPPKGKGGTVSKEARRGRWKGKAQRVEPKGSRRGKKSGKEK